MISTSKHENLLCVLALLLSTAAPYVGAQSPPSPTDPYQYANFSPSMAVIIVVLIAALFFMAIFSIYVRHCTEGDNGGTVRPVAGGQSVGRRDANRGLDSAVLETFPTFAYSAVKGLKIGKGALECAVCLNEFEDEDTLRLLPKCDHVFHPECIDAWLSSHTTCPVCRANLAIVSDETPVTADVISTIPPIAYNDDDDSPESTNQSNRDELRNSVSVQVYGDQDGDNQIQQTSEPVLMNPSRSMNQNSVLRSRSIKSLFFSKFPRSHSTGHSLIQPGENLDRFTLRLPQDVRKQIMNKRLNRTTSLLILPRETSSRRGYRTGGEGSRRGKSYRRLESFDQVGKSDRWIFSIVPPFLSRSASIRSLGGERTSSSIAARGFITSLKKSFSRLNSKVTEPGLVTTATGSARPPV